jgi:hypothetical protein
MTDVRLVVTNPEDSSIVPAACNAKGELKLEEPIKFDGNLDEPLTCTSLDSSSFAGSLCIGGISEVGIGTTNPLAKLDVNGQVYAWSNTETVRFKSSRTGTSDILTVWGDAANISSGTKVFSVSGSGDVTLGSRGKQWLIRESNGVAMLIEQTRLGKLDEYLSNQDEVEVRDLPSEIDACLKALNEVMQRLRMTPPAGWPVWDGSDINSEI